MNGKRNETKTDVSTVGMFFLSSQDHTVMFTMLPPAESVKCQFADALISELDNVICDLAYLGFASGK